MNINDKIGDTEELLKEEVNVNYEDIPFSDLEEEYYPSISLKDILITETGQGDITSNDYLEHPLNFSKSEGLAQMLRGFTGFANKYLGMNSLRIAILDVIMGAMRFMKEGKNVTS